MNISEEYKLIITDLNSFLNDQAGAFAFGAMGIDMARQQVIQILNENGADPDKHLLIGNGEPNHPKTMAYQKWKIGSLNSNLSKGGIVYVTLGHQWAVTVYAYWEHVSRPRLAKAQGVKLHEIKEPIFGDLRLIRHSILHNKGVALSDVRKLEVLKWFSPGESIQITEEKVSEFMAKCGLTFRP